MNKSKRGRKPKSNIIVNSSPIFDNNDNNQNIILKIKKPVEINQSKYIELIDNKEYIHNNYCCIYCDKNIISNTMGIPIKYNKMCFSTVYNFCNTECIYNYINKHDINEYYEIHSLLHLYNLMIKDNKYPLVKELPYNRQIKNESQDDFKKYKLQRNCKNKKSFFNIFQ